MQNHELDDEETEPPVPPGLGQLSDTLDSLAEFLRIDEDLLHVAAEASAPMGDARPSREEVDAWVAGLPAGEKDDVLARLLVEEDMTAATELLHRLLKRHSSVETPAGRRTVGKLLEAAEARAEARRQAEARKRAEDAERRKRQAAAARAKHLDEIAGREPEFWARLRKAGL